jgi:hypothetical protein
VLIALRRATSNGAHAREGRRLRGAARIAPRRFGPIAAPKGLG